MVKIDVRITEKSMPQLIMLPGIKFFKYCAEPGKFSNRVFETVGLFIGNEVYALTNSQHVVDYFGAEEEIVLLQFDKTTACDLPAIAGELNMVDTPIDRLIKEVRLVQENQKLYESSELTYDVYLTRGIIFVMEDGYEVSFEKDNPFVETIAICRGYNLIDQFTPKEDAIEDLRSNQTMTVERTIQILS